jgi:hypothetical protein
MFYVVLILLSSCKFFLAVADPLILAICFSRFFAFESQWLAKVGTAAALLGGCQRHFGYPLGKPEHLGHGGAASPSPRGSDHSFTPGKQHRLHAREGSTPSPWGSHHTSTAGKRRDKSTQVRHTRSIPQVLELRRDRQLLAGKESIIQLWLGVWWRWKELHFLFGDGRHMDDGEARSTSPRGSDPSFTSGKRHQLPTQEGSGPSPWRSHHSFIAGKRRDQASSFYTHTNLSHKAHSEFDLTSVTPRA